MEGEAELREFVKATLFEITEGLRDANEAYKRSRSASDNAFVLKPGKGSDESDGIHFDVAVTTRRHSGLRGQPSPTIVRHGPPLDLL